MGATVAVFTEPCQEPIFLKELFEAVTHDSKKRASHSHTIFLLEDFLIHLKTGGFQTDFQ
jgi:hypothetical protein